MKKLIIVFAVLVLGIVGVRAQNKQLSVVESGDGMDIYPCGNRHEAQVVFNVNDVFSLSFKSTLDDSLEVVVDTVGIRKSYSIVLITQEPGVNYSNRELTIMAPGFADYTLPLDLKDKDKKIYDVTDPYSQFKSPFYTYQEKGNELFYAGEYQSARDYYNMTKACPEYASDSASIIKHIMDCDSLIVWAIQAEEHEHFAEWEEALDTYRKMMTVNSSNQAIRDAYSHCKNSQASDCEAEFRNGEHYMVQGHLEDLQKAVECFQSVIDKKCSLYAREASINLKNVKRQIEMESDHARVLMYDMGPNQLFGFTYATCNNSGNKRYGGYFTLRFNKDVIDLASKKSFVEGNIKEPLDITSSIALKELKEEDFNYDKELYERDEYGEWAAKDLHYEAQMTFGWTNQLYRWFFIHYGLGYHGGGFYTFRVSNSTASVFEKQKGVSNAIDLSKPSTWNTAIRKSYSKVNWFNAPAVEIGLIVKVYRFAVKGTYQYNYWLGDDNYTKFYKDNTHKFYFGLGFTW